MLQVDFSALTNIIVNCSAKINRIPVIDGNVHVYMWKGILAGNLILSIVMCLCQVNFCAEAALVFRWKVWKAVPNFFKLLLKGLFLLLHLMCIKPCILCTFPEQVIHLGGIQTYDLCIARADAYIDHRASPLARGTSIRYTGLLYLRFLGLIIGLFH